jgi:hypothetical protein
MFSAQDSEALPWFNTHFSRHTVQGSENEMAAFVDDPLARGLSLNHLRPNESLTFGAILQADCRENSICVLT